MVSVSIPNELILEILLRLPAKSVQRFHCVSKQWASMLRGPYFTEKFLTKSSAQPRIIFAIENDGLWSIFSLPQNLRPYENSSSSSLTVTAEFHMKFPPDDMRIFYRDDRRFSCGYASGLIYFYAMHITQEDYDGVPVICNPKTGRYATLPFLRRYRKSYSFFGFDPIDKQYKVLCMRYAYGPFNHKVITLGSREMSWKRIKCPLKHMNASDGICINGVVYYLNDTSEARMARFLIVCFDVRSEKFKFIKPESYCPLINYKGKLGLVYYDDYADDVVEFRVCVLEDEEKQGWSEYAYTLRDEKFLDHYVSVVGVTVTGEIVLSMADYTSKQPFYVFYFNPERNTLRRVEVQGFGEYHEALDSPSRVHVFVDECSSSYTFAYQVEDLNVKDPKLLKSNIYSLPYFSIYAESDQDRNEEYDEVYEEEEYGEYDDEYGEYYAEYDDEYGEYDAEYGENEENGENGEEEEDMSNFALEGN